MKMKRILWGFSMIAALALLAGCGGGGGTSLMIDGERATQALIDAATSARDAAQNSVTELQGQLDTANENAMNLQTMLDDANTNAGNLQSMLDDANAMIDTLNMQIADAPTQAMVDELTMMRDNYKQQAETLQGQLDTANGQVTQLTADLDTANGQVTQLTADLNAANQRLAMLTSPTEDPMAAMTRKVIRAGKQAWMGGGETGAATTPAFETNGDMSKLDGTDAPELQGSVGAGMGGFRQATFTSTDTDDNDMHKVVVFSDRDDLKNVAFNVYYSAVADRPSYTVTTGIGETVGADDNAITFTAATLFGPNVGGRFASNIPDMDTTDNTKPNSFDGTFHGVPGTYRCSGGDCAVGYDAAGKARQYTTTGSGVLSFVPDDPKSMLQSVRPDADYLSFGYWLTTPEDGDPSVTFFAFGGNILTTADDATYLSGLTETAKYEGLAAGKYARTALNTDAGKTVAVEAGLFSATADLTASFGGGDVAENAKFTLQGTVSDFTNMDTGDVIASNWEVTLGRASFRGDSETGDTVSAYTGVRGGTTETLGNKTAGMWNADFYGTDLGAADADSGPVVGGSGAAADGVPLGVAGTFDATFANGDVIGAFGATRQDN